MKLFVNARQSIKTALIRSGRARARTELLRLSDRSLADAGFSRELLESGLRAWPWRDNAVASSQTELEPLAVAQRRAERELQQLSDAELDDLAIARVDIPRAVREGRVGIELPMPATADLRRAA